MNDEKEAKYLMLFGLGVCAVLIALFVAVASTHWMGFTHGYSYSQEQHSVTTYGCGGQTK